MSQTKALYRLQKLDLDIDTRRNRVSAITAALEQDSALRQAQAEVSALEEALRPQQTHVTDLTLELQSIADQTKQLTSRLYGGQVSSPKELEDLQNKIAERKRRHASLENTLLETMIAIEELQASSAEATSQLDHVERAWTAQLQALTEEMVRLKQEIKTLKVDRQTASQQVSPDNLELYQTLRARKQGHALALLEGESCSMCGVGQTTTLVQQVRLNQELILCSSCGRILVAL